jgi:hypothetical protein
VVKIVGSERVERRFRNAGNAAAVDLVGRALYVAADMVKAEAQHLITQGSISGKAHVPSQPEEPPNADTHSLDRQIEAALVAPLKAQVTSNAAHGLPLELGTSTMAERPYMRPALAHKRQEALEKVAEAVNRANRMA